MTASKKLGPKGSISGNIWAWLIPWIISSGPSCLGAVIWHHLVCWPPRQLCWKCIYWYVGGVLHQKKGIGTACEQNTDTLNSSNCCLGQSIIFEILNHNTLPNPHILLCSKYFFFCILDLRYWCGTTIFVSSFDKSTRDSPPLFFFLSKYTHFGGLKKTHLHLDQALWILGGLG